MHDGKIMVAALACFVCFCVGVASGQIFMLDTTTECLRHKEWCAEQKPGIFERIFPSPSQEKRDK